MFEFINYLKLIATVLITNSHFGNIWPMSALATGGLLGNVIFFAVSGFLLYNIKTNFAKWFSKRFFRVYPALAIFTLFAVSIGEYGLNSFEDAFRLFIYPTNYIFLVWLIVCYCFMYIYIYIMNKGIKNFLEKTAISVFVIWILVYIMFCDKSVYSVDDVSKPFILFLYMESMLLGSLFRKNKLKVGCFKVRKVIITACLFVMYAVSKIVFSKIESLSQLQILNQFIILAALFSVFDLFMSMETIFRKMPKKLNNVVKHVANITLQIYVVQFVIINHFAKIVFPLNLLTVTLLILIAATLLYYIEVLIRKGLEASIGKLKKG